jgi:hypothetical protein
MVNNSININIALTLTTMSFVKSKEIEKYVVMSPQWVVISHVKYQIYLRENYVFHCLHLYPSLQNWQKDFPLLTRRKKSYQKLSVDFL